MERYWSTDFYPLKSDEGAVLGINAVVADITERKQAEEMLRVSHEQLRSLAARLQSVREEERTRVAREIHDVLAQDLTRLKLDLMWLSHRLAKTIDRGTQKLLQEKLVGMTELTDAAIRSVQTIATELRPVVLDSLGLCAAIEWQAREFQERTGIQCAAFVPEEEIRLDRDRSTALFRIVQESLTNVARHASATKVEIRLLCKARQLTLAVRDNGRGIKTGKPDDPHSLGLLGMRERALLLGGRCEITGPRGKGTTVEVRLPLGPSVHPEDKQ